MKTGGNGRIHSRKQSFIKQLMSLQIFKWTLTILLTSSVSVLSLSQEKGTKAKFGIGIQECYKFNLLAPNSLRLEFYTANYLDMRFLETTSPTLDLNLTISLGL